MRIAFFSNYLNHHQLAFCEEMDQLTHHQFIFVAVIPTPAFRLQLGYQEMNDEYPFVLKAYESQENKAAAKAVAMNYDVVIFGEAPEYYLKERIKKNLLTIRCAERLYRDSILSAFSPRGMLHRFSGHTQYALKKMYLLCASAYASFDFLLSGAYIGKAYKWGYFPELQKHDPDELWKKKRLHTILWVGRLINLKHPELALEVAERLIIHGIQFEMNIIGSGEMEAELRRTIEQKQLTGIVHLRGNMKSDEVRKYMDESEVFLFTSDFQEGWGAVLNEAMNSGCAVIASHAIGSVPYLIEDGRNGLIYKNGDKDQLFHLTKRILSNPLECEELGKAAYQTIAEKWNAKIAAERLMIMVEDLIKEGKCVRYKDGPCSRAKTISNWWYKDHKSKGG